MPASSGTGSNCTCSGTTRRNGPGSNGPCSGSSSPDVEGLFEEYREQGVFHERTALRRTAWGTREFAFYDLDMNGLTFYRDLAADESADPAADS